jgi:hypothetical protein
MTTPPMDERPLDERSVQTVRLMLMMYRQGWLDAAEYLAGETMRQARAMQQEYNRLVDQ